ncbi:putative calcium-binding protein [Roseivivax marinus]|uniref:Putative calcium-binding protein n=1 Tax=Roseivivax marinus TaxID=1379903 RepID=W4HFP7_9RHOB|nr:calcium-binding protein [Roseivivax marinus]ETW10815.1 putative calcium-binding protein [Roseivivax marinus]
MLTLVDTTTLDTGSVGFTYISDNDEFFAYSTEITRLGRDGSSLDSFASPGESANDYDLDWLETGISLGDTEIPAGTLLVFNGETDLLDIYAVDPDTGDVIASLETDFGNSHVVGGAYHEERATFFAIQDTVPEGEDLDSLIAEIDPVTGEVLNTFATTDFAEDFTIFYGDIEVEQSTGTLLITSSREGRVMLAEPDGSSATIEDFPDDVTGTFAGISDIPGDPESVFLATLDGTVYELTDLRIEANGPEVLVGIDGDDSIDGLGGDDRLEGGAGNDTLNGGPGNDGLLGEDGDDELTGGPGKDNIAGSDGNDVISGGDDDDFLGGGLGNDTMEGNSGADTLGGGFGNDEVDGGDGDDVAAGGPGDDFLTGGQGNDTMGGSFGTDTVIGLGGDDSLGGGTGMDSLDGGAGDDLLGGGEGDDTVVGGTGNDFLAGGGRDDIVEGGAGNDTINGGDGDDTLEGGAGEDVFVWNVADPGAVDVIADFEDGLDSIRLTGIQNAPGSGLQGRVDALAIQDATLDGALGAELSYNGQTIFLSGVSASELSLADFDFL